MNTTGWLSKLVEVRKEVNFNDDTQFSPDAVHCVIDREPSADHGPMFPHQKRVQVDVNLPYGIMRTVRVVIQYSLKKKKQ